MPEKTNFDIIILGAGPAGMTAVVYAARKQLDVLVISDDIGGQAMWSAAIENYLGFILISGSDLVQKFEEHIRIFNVPQEFTTATRVSSTGEVFRVETADGRTFQSRALILATGKSPRLLDVPGEKEFRGRGVVYCATCDGPLYAGRTIAVVGGGNSGLDAVVQMMKICPKVYLIDVEPKLRADDIMVRQAQAAPNVEIISNTRVREILGGDFVQGIQIENTETHERKRLDIDGVFIEIGLAPNSACVKDLVRLNSRGEVPVDCAARTSVPGLYAAGDVTDVPEKQIIIAAGDGAKAALGAYSYIVRLPVAADDWGPMTAEANA